jgi:Mn-dependent DtxR family transcriptional regulator
MYLETILLLSRRGGFVRSIDISEHMGYSKPSVSRAMSVLKRDGYITMDDENHISLTEAGLAVAEKIYARHEVLRRMLVHLGVSPVTASNDACKMEHTISDETFLAIENYLRKLG